MERSGFVAKEKQMPTMSLLSMLLHVSLPGKWDDWERQADPSDVWIDACVVDLNEWISDDVSYNLRV